MFETDRDWWADFWSLDSKRPSERCRNYNLKWQINLYIYIWRPRGKNHILTLCCIFITFKAPFGPSLVVQSAFPVMCVSLYPFMLSKLTCITTNTCLFQCIFCKVSKTWFLWCSTYCSMSRTIQGKRNHSGVLLIGLQIRFKGIATLFWWLTLNSNVITHPRHAQMHYRLQFILIFPVFSCNLTYIIIGCRITYWSWQI